MTGTAAEWDAQFGEWLLTQLYIAYRQARRGKRRTNDELLFETNEMENLMLLRDDIMARTYKPSRGIAFVVHRPVIREIFAAPFRDRVVHHFLYNMVYDWWDRRLIYDSYSCRIGKGTLMGIQRLEKRMKGVSKNWTEETYVVKLDIEGYFMSLPRKGLYEKVLWGLERQFPQGGRVCDVCKYLWREVIFDDPTKGVERRGSAQAWAKVPASKSLFCQPPGQGIVIGNLSSQLLSNIYLDALDRFVTMELGYKKYGRYVDDFYIVVTKAELGQLMRDVKVIEDFLFEMGLKLHPRKRHIQEVHKGVEFLGAVIYPGRVVPGKRLVRFFEEAVYFGQNRPNYVDSVQSYLGHLKHFDSQRAVEKMFREMGWDYKY